MSKFQHPTAFCKFHGFFPATAIALGAGSSATMVGCVTNCPSCGSDSEIVPGNYQAFADRINLLIDPSISRDALAALQQIAARAKANKITPDEAKNEAEKVAPGAGRLFDVANWGDQAKATLYAAIIGAAAVVGAAKLATSGAPPSVTIQPTIERIIERPVFLPPSVLVPTLEEFLKKHQSVPPPRGRPKKNRKRR